MAKKPSPHMCFVLLSKNALPTKKSLEAALKTFPDLGKVQIKVDKDNDAVTLTCGDVQAMAALMWAPVPNGEADGATDHSLSGLNGSWTLPEHRAHLIVVEGGPAPSLANLVVFTRLVAVLVRATSSVGVYWGKSGATHHPDFVIDIAQSELPLPIWVGVSIASSKTGYELLSLGMRQLGLPDLLLKAKSVNGGELEFFYDLLAYVAQRGKKLPEGNTVGRDEGEKLKVKYVKSPIDAKQQVWSVTLPAGK